MSELKKLASAAVRPGAALRAAREDLESRLRHRAPLTEQDEAALAAEFDAVRGFNRPRRDLSKVAHELAEGAPFVTWTPPARRPRTQAVVDRHA